MKHTKIILHFSAFIITCVNLGLGWITEQTWMAVIMAILAVYSGARVADNIVNMKRTNGQK